VTVTVEGLRCSLGDSTSSDYDDSPEEAEEEGNRTASLPRDEDEDGDRETQMVALGSVSTAENSDREEDYFAQDEGEGEGEDEGADDAADDAAEGDDAGDAGDDTEDSKQAENGEDIHGALEHGRFERHQSLVLLDSHRRFERHRSLVLLDSPAKTMRRTSVSKEWWIQTRLGILPSLHRCLHSSSLSRFLSSPCS
jgi:hypothetical protein